MMNSTKCSFYVWFVGQRELLSPNRMDQKQIVRQLLSKSTSSSSFPSRPSEKVTLQIHAKGLNMLDMEQQRLSTVGRHQIGHVQSPHKDIVSAVFTLGPSKHRLHVFRCDSPESADLLRGQLISLCSSNNNLVRKETMVSEEGSKLGSDGRSVDRNSESEEEMLEEQFKHEARPPTLYDSLAAELREKLGDNRQVQHPPLLLPPRDYDTVHRQKGDLAKVDERRALNPLIVGHQKKRGEAASTSTTTTKTRGEGVAVRSSECSRPLVNVEAYEERRRFRAVMDESEEEHKDTKETSNAFSVDKAKDVSRRVSRPRSASKGETSCGVRPSDIRRLEQRAEEPIKKPPRASKTSAITPTTTTTPSRRTPATRMRPASPPSLTPPTLAPPPATSSTSSSSRHEHQSRRNNAWTSTNNVRPLLFNESRVRLSSASSSRQRSTGSPEAGRRNRPELRREKTSSMLLEPSVRSRMNNLPPVSNYPSLDVRSEKRKGMFTKASNVSRPMPIVDASLDALINRKVAAAMANGQRMANNPPHIVVMAPHHHPVPHGLIRPPWQVAMDPNMARVYGRRAQHPF